MRAPPPPSAAPERGAVRTLWTYSSAHGIRGLSAVREKGWLLAWDEKNWLYLLNHKGETQSQRQIAGTLTAACGADDGSAYAAGGSNGEVYWLAPDLMPRWERSVSAKVLALATDPFGQYLAVADGGGKVQVLDRFGRVVCQLTSPRPLHHLAFVPAAPYLLGASDFGLVACFDLEGKSVWRDGLVAHIGSLAVSGDGEQIVLACFTEGLQRYALNGRSLDRLTVSGPCRAACVTFDGRLTLVAWLARQLLVLDAGGKNLCTHTFDLPVGPIALSALGDSAYVALTGGPLLGLDLRGI